MLNKDKEQEHFTNHLTVYGPVTSWRFGESLGIDPIYKTSTCSFNCIYCQLGHIQNITNEFSEYVPTQKIINDFKELIKDDTKIDVITYSGSGEPTLASNLGEIIQELKAIRPNVEHIVLTNATELDRVEVRENLKDLDRVILKIDAPNEELYQLINRPAKGVSLERTLNGIDEFKKSFKGTIEIQCMFMPTNKKGIEDLAAIFKRINPSVIQLNTPKRPYPLSWHRENRGNHLKIFDYEVRELKTLTKEEAQKVESQLRELTGLNILSIYRD